MKQPVIMRLILMATIMAVRVGAANAQTSAEGETVTSAQSQNTSEALKKLDQLVDQNKQLEKQNEELMEQIKVLRQGLATPSTKAAESAPKVPEANDPSQLTNKLVTAVNNIPEPDSLIATDTQKKSEAGTEWGSYTPNFGYKVANTKYGDLNVSVYTYVRYLNQRGLAPTYRNYFGAVTTLQRRQDFQLLKVQMKFLGWMFNPKFRYFLYAWSSNASQGLGAQVVLAGNLNYTFNKYLTLSGGITSLPGTRSVEGNFPFWLSVDSRLIADEFFRPSYTSGFWARGDITRKLRYQAMIGNNLSTLGVSAAQLDNGLNTVATALVWTPTTGEFGAGFGDFENHEGAATRFGAHFTRSHETRQSQPSSDAFENTQIRLSDGSVIFVPNLFGPGTTVTAVNYQMVSADGGLKYHGYSLWGEGFFRWLNNFSGPGTAGLPRVYDNGLQVQASAMPIPKTLQVYLGGSAIFGKYGNPWDTRLGINWFPFKNRVLRWNTEGLYLYNSPAGYPSVPFPLGGHGFVFHTNLEMAF